MFNSTTSTEPILRVDGKFFQLHGERVFLRMVTYGPFPDPQPDHFEELEKIKRLGFHAVRLYEPPSDALLKAALEHGVLIFSAFPWQWCRVFLGEARGYLYEGILGMKNELQRLAGHPSVVGFFIANEISADLARWMTPSLVREALDDVLLECKRIAPSILYSYASYPTSEYLEPMHADFTSMNVYLEEAKDLEKYIAHLHHVAGDRPVLISEIGIDTLRKGEMTQAAKLPEYIESMRHHGVAGFSIFAWSDRWRNGGLVVDDWKFGLTREDGSLKPAALALQDPVETRGSYSQRVSVIVCTYNGALRIGDCLAALVQVRYSDFEIIVVDDGSIDKTCEIVRTYQKDYATSHEIHMVEADHGGLSVARNMGASHATGDIIVYTDDDCMVDEDWVYWIVKGFSEQECDLLGGPNIPPFPIDEDEAIVAAAPGAPTHVMHTDQLAEHIPGCNMAFTREAFERLSGFRSQYETAGDDVDVCWRAEALSMKIGFHGAAFVWHRRRTSLYRYLKQQWGYGKSEALLMGDHLEKFGLRGVQWAGVIYGGGAMAARQGDVIYSGLTGDAGYQYLVSNMMPSRPMHASKVSLKASFKLSVMKCVQPWLRRVARYVYAPKSVRREIRRRMNEEKKVAEKPVRDKGSLAVSSSAGLVHRECVLDDQSATCRSEYIERLKTLGWVAYQQVDEGGACEFWDMEKSGGMRVLLAKENLGGGAFRLLIRMRALYDEKFPHEI